MAPAVSTALPLRGVIPLWRASLVTRGLSPRTIAGYVDRVSDLAGSLGETATTADLTPERIRTYQQRLAAKRAPKTVSASLSAIRSLCRYLVDAELRVDDPTLRIASPKLPKPLPRALPPAQLRQVLAALKQPDDLTAAAAYQWARNVRVLKLALFAGLRISEIANLRWRDVDLERGVLQVRGGKGNKDRSVPLHPSVLGDLRLAASGRGPSDAVCGQAGGEAITRKSMAHICERWVPRLGLPFEFTLHQLRHSFVTELIVAGANVFDVQALAGHEDPKTTARYYALSAEHLRGAVEKLPGMW